MNKPLHITFLDFDDLKNPLLAGGQARATFEVAKRLVKKGHTVTVLSSKYPGYKDRFEEGIFYRHIGLGTPNIKLNNLMYILTVPFHVKNLRSNIIIECFTAPISTLFSPVFTKIPVVALPSMFNAQEFTRKYKLPFHLIEKFGVRFYKYIMPYSKIDKKKISGMNPKITAKIIPQGVCDEYLSIKAKKSKYILFLGRFDIAQKGIDLLLEAYAKIADKISYPLVIAGHGPDEKKILGILKKLSLEKSVSLIGPLYGDEKLKVMSRAAAVAFPSRHDELSLWALEALGGGLPLVIFDLPECRWIDTDAALKARPFDVEEYGNLLIKAVSPKKNAEMRIKARELAMRYSWDRVAGDFENFMQLIIRKEKKS